VPRRAPYRVRVGAGSRHSNGKKTYLRIYEQQGYGPIDRPSNRRAGLCCSLREGERGQKALRGGREAPSWIGSYRPHAWVWRVLLAVTTVPVAPLQAQQRPSSPPGVGAVLTGCAARMPLLMNADGLNWGLEPFAGAPQDTLGVLLDAARYPNDLIEAARWSQQPEATRGPARPGSPSSS
jgi:hypothetical protein